MGGVKFGVTEDGQPGYKKDGADTVYPFNNVYKGLQNFGDSKPHSSSYELTNCIIGHCYILFIYGKYGDGSGIPVLQTGAEQIFIISSGGVRIAGASGTESYSNSSVVAVKATSTTITLKKFSNSGAHTVYAIDLG